MPPDEISPDDLLAQADDDYDGVAEMGDESPDDALDDEDD